MLKSIASIFTTSAPVGVALRYLGTILGTVLTVAGVLGLLDQAQIDALRNEIPGFVSALSALATAAVAIYAIFTKSSSDKAAEVAKQVDAKVPADALVIVKTPAGQQDIVVHPK
ncbi:MULTISPECIES: hypothetical protein [Phyllobacteriaceae]|jgi:hypothetical protein|uniref:Holin n=1 Tax=Mesorhizobium hungaricum TaxID=1566387 RepID=A0A1C2DDA0_9HYPH|nr:MULTISPECIES: hypothetical protein [Mesorhizobium]MBN9235080.1 hypothetical protein [Mesorhizobium sp.]OCX12719.1 hypothetical protein QV13_24280 [Mesorhizobium hungaricum]